MDQANCGREPWFRFLSRFFRWPAAVFALIFLWKAVLLAGFSLPVPSNDSFFYDGPVVNLLLHDRYANPAIAPALPISGTEMFCAYPPLYQTVLWGWMAMFGTSVISAMALHLVLVGLYMLILLAILRRLRLPVWTIHVGGLFLLGITFHDRPDSLAHLFGIAAVYTWIRSRPSLDPTESSGSPGWAWAMATLGILTLATSVQIGGLYCVLLGLGVFGACIVGEDKIPFSPLAALGVVPIGLVALVAVGFPHVWAGFLEHARQTPSLTGWRRPLPGELLKILRTVPGILAVAVLLPLTLRGALARRGGRAGLPPDARRLALVAVSCIPAPLAIIAAALCVLTPNSVFFAAYLQPLLVAAFLGLAATLLPDRPPVRWHLWLFLALAGLASIRAVGMTTWGVACALRDGRRNSLDRVETELVHCAPGDTVVLSSAYLYQAALHLDVTWIHSDWMAPTDRHRPDTDWEGLTHLRPTRIILTQFDYYRRYQPLLDKLKARPDLARCIVANTASIPAPDSMPSLQKVVQHISWEPVVVTIGWNPRANTR
jgi:hypothetical protein